MTGRIWNCVFVWAAGTSVDTFDFTLIGPSENCCYCAQAFRAKNELTGRVRTSTILV